VAKRKDYPEGIHSYKEALNEIQIILSTIEQSEIDIDELVSLVQRASTLISFCKKRLDQANAKVELILGDLSTVNEDGSSTKEVEP